MTAASNTSRAWYGATISEFLGNSPEAAIDILVTHSTQEVTQQRDAWLKQIAILRYVLEGRAGNVFLEFNIPRMGRRIDTVVILVR